MSTKPYPVARFRLGQIVATPNALAHLTQDDILAGISRHQSGDWAMWTSTTGRPTTSRSSKAHGCSPLITAPWE